MPFIDTVVLQPLVGLRYENGTSFTDYNNAMISWTGIANYWSWIFVDGQQVIAPLDYGAILVRSQKIPFDITLNHTVHVLEEPANVAVTSPDYMPEELPALYWWPVPEADLFRIYHKAPASVEIVEQEVNVNPLIAYYAWKPKRRHGFDTVDGQWHKFRVESIDVSAGTQSTTLSKDVYVYGFPSIPSSSQVTGTGGVFTLTVFK